MKTNLGGFNQAGYPSPDYYWVSMMAEEFPGLQVQFTYQVPSTRQEAITSYEVRVCWPESTRRAWIEIEGPGRWSILEN